MEYFGKIVAENVFPTILFVMAVTIQISFMSVSQSRNYMLHKEALKQSGTFLMEMINIIRLEQSFGASG